jgi:cytochrome c551/c552
MKSGMIIGSLLLAIALQAMAFPANAAEDDEAVANPDLKCLKCHSKSLKKSLEDGTKMSLHIDAAEFGESVHQVIGCTGCHRDVPKGKHPSKKTDRQPARVLG